MEDQLSLGGALLRTGIFYIKCKTEQYQGICTINEWLSNHFKIGPISQARQWSKLQESYCYYQKLITVL